MKQNYDWLTVMSNVNDLKSKREEIFKYEN